MDDSSNLLFQQFVIVFHQFYLSTLSTATGHRLNIHVPSFAFSIKQPTDGHRKNSFSTDFCYCLDGKKMETKLEVTVSAEWREMNVVVWNNNNNNSSSIHCLLERPRVGEVVGKL